MQIRLPDGALIEIEPTAGAFDPDNHQHARKGFNWGGIHTWLRINGGPWHLMARTDWSTLLMDVAKEARDLVEYEGYLKRYWHEEICDPGMIEPPRPVHEYGLDTWSDEKAPLG